MATARINAANASLPKLPMTVQQVASLYGLSRSQVYREIEAGRLHARHKRGEQRIWYITDADLEEWIDHGMWDEEGE